MRIFWEKLNYVFLFTFCLFLIKFLISDNRLVLGLMHEKRSYVVTVCFQNSLKDVYLSNCAISYKVLVIYRFSGWCKVSVFWPSIPLTVVFYCRFYFYSLLFLIYFADVNRYIFILLLNVWLAGTAVTGRVYIAYEGFL